MPSRPNCANWHELHTSGEETTRQSIHGYGAIYIYIYMYIYIYDMIYVYIKICMYI